MYRDMRDASDDLQMARHPRVSTYANLGVCLTVLGYPVAGAAMAAEGIRHAEALSRPVSLTAGLRRACVRSMMQRDVQSVVNLSARISVLNAKHETFVGTHEGAIFREWAQLRTKRSGDAMERVSFAIEKLDAANHWVMLPFFMTSIAEILGEHGDRDRAIALIERADQLATLTGERWSKAESMRVEARLKADEPAVAIELLQASIAVAREQGAKLWELRAAKDLAEMWHARGRSAPACEVLLPVSGGFKETSKHRTFSPLESCSPVSSDRCERRLSA